MKLNMVAKEYGRREHTVMNLRGAWGKNAQSSIKGCIKSSRLSHKQVQQAGCSGRSQAPSATQQDTRKRYGERHEEEGGGNTMCYEWTWSLYVTSICGGAPTVCVMPLPLCKGRGGGGHAREVLQVQVVHQLWDEVQQCQDLEQQDGLDHAQVVENGAREGHNQRTEPAAQQGGGGNWVVEEATIG